MALGVPLPSFHLLGAVTTPSPPVRVRVLFLTGWQSDPLVLVAYGIMFALAALYVLGIWRLASRGRHWSNWRTASFLSGLLVVVISIGSGVGYYDDYVFTDHVVQHLLLMSMAPPLLALGAPITLLLQTSARKVKSVTLRILHSRPVRVISHPAVTLALAVGTMYVYFLTPLYPYSLAHPLFHDYTHLHFLLVGCLYWWPLVGVDPMPSRLSYPARLGALGVAIPFNAFLGVVIMNMSQTIAPQHTLADTHMGGAVMWAFSEVFTIGAIAILFSRWSRSDEREAARLDRRSLHGPAAVTEGSRALSPAREQALRKRSVIPTVSGGSALPEEPRSNL